MKKLMIAAAIVCAAAMSQAAATEWRWQATTSAAVKTVDGDNATGDAYILGGFTSSGINASRQAMLTALRGLGETATLASLESTIKGNANYWTSGELTDGKLNATEFTETISGGIKVYGYGLLLDQAEDGSLWAYFTQSGSGTGVDTGNIGAGTMSLTSTATTQYDLKNTTGDGRQPGWYQITAAAVPEPTSGLLLLLGMAGLALRRRRA